MFKFIVLFLTFGLSLADESCDTLGVLFYEDIGCKPVKVEGKACPVKFKCDDFTLKNGICLLKSEIFKSGELVDNAVTESSCRVDCFCNPGQHAGKGLFTCKLLKCSEWDWTTAIRIGCYHIYTQGRCCADKQMCGLDGRAKCEIDGKTFYEGERFYPEDSCLTCICQKGFDSKRLESFCERTVCSTQLHNSDKLAENCAPVYFGKKSNLCCPHHEYVCPKDTDVIKRFTDVKDSDLKCKFGKHVVKLGEGVESEVNYWGSNRNVKCECIMPPFLTCRSDFHPLVVTKKKFLKKNSFMRESRSSRKGSAISQKNNIWSINY